MAEEFLNKSRVLVVGAGGYIGSALMDALQDNCDVRVGTSRCDKINDSDFDNIDVVINAAGAAHERFGSNNREKLLVNSDFPAQLLRAAAAAGVTYFIQISSIAVYSPSAKLIDPKTPTEPESLYGKSKLVGEQNLKSVSGCRVKLLILRLPMVYGPDAPGNPRKLLNFMSRYRFLPLGGIANRRSFLSIINLAAAITSVVATRPVGTFCLADDQTVSTSQLVAYLAKSSKRSVKLFWLPGLSILLRLFPQTYSSLYSDLEIADFDFKNRFDPPLILTSPCAQCARRLN